MFAGGPFLVIRRTCRTFLASGLGVPLAPVAGFVPKRYQKVDPRPHRRYGGDMAASSAAVRFEQPLHVPSRQDLIEQDAVIAPAGM